MRLATQRGTHRAAGVGLAVRNPLATIAAAALFGLVAPVQTSARSEASSAASGASVVDVAGSESLYAAPTRVDRVGRVLAAVHVNGQGPFRFILDTGANSSALAPRLVKALRLPSAAEPVVDVYGVTGTAMLPAVHVELLRAGDIEIRDVSLPVLSDGVFAGADGILGVEGLQAARIEVDFTRDRVVITQSSRQRPASGFLTVPVQLHSDGLLMATGRVGRVRVKVIIDTGAQNTLGNLPLKRALEHRVDRRNQAEATVIGVTPDVRTGTAFLAPAISIGGATLQNLPVTFDDLPVFKLWGLADEPALLVGMDLIGTLQQFVVDYPRQELQIKVQPAKSKPGLRRCAPYECATRIPHGGS